MLCWKNAESESFKSEKQKREKLKKRQRAYQPKGGFKMHKKRLFQKGKYPVVPIALALVLLLGGCAAPSSQTAEKTEDKKAIEAVLVETTVAAKTAFSDTIQISGNAIPYDEVMVSAKISGDLTSLGGAEGAYVKKGQQLARIDDTRYRLGKEKAVLGHELAVLNLEEKKKDVERYKTLYEQNAISQKEYEAVVNAYKQLEISVRSAENDLKAADVDFKDTAVTAPISGIVSQRKVYMGQAVSPGLPMFNIVDTSSLYVSTGVPESIINQMKVGMKVNVAFQPLAGKSYEGKITHISPVQDQAKLYTVKILVGNGKGEIKAGMFATGDVVLAGSVEGIAIPKIAVIHEQGKDYVFVSDGTKAIRKEVAVGLGNQENFEITSGITEGEKVIIKGQDKVKDGTPVKVAP